MAYYGDISVESRLKIQALEQKFYQEIKALADELPDVTKKEIQQMVFEDMRIEKPIVRRGPSHYNAFVREESKKCGSMEEAVKRYSQLSESEKLALKEAHKRNPAPAQETEIVEQDTNSPFNVYSEKLRKLVGRMYSDANCHVICYVAQRRVAGTNPNCISSYSVYSTNLARQYDAMESNFLGQYFHSFVSENDNGIVRCNTPMIRRVKDYSATGTTVKQPQKLQAEKRSQFTKLVLDTLKKADTTHRLKELKTVPWKKLRQTRRCYGLRLVGWPEHVPINSVVNPEDLKLITSLIEKEKILFV